MEEKGGRNLYGFTLNDPVDHIDLNGKLTVTIANPVAFFGTVIAIEVVIIYNELKPQMFNQKALADAITENNGTMSALQQIINDPENNTFQSANIRVGGKFAVRLPATWSASKCQDVINEFEKGNNGSGSKTAAEELFSRIALRGWEAVPGELQQTPDERAQLAKALLDRQNAYAAWLWKQYQPAPVANH